MKKISSLLILSAFIGLVIFSCEKKKDDPVPETPTTPITSTNTRTKLLINKNWVLTAGTISPGISYSLGFGDPLVITDLFDSRFADDPLKSAFPEAQCFKDDTIRFSAVTDTSSSGTTKYRTGTKICGSETNSDSGTWKFNSNQTILQTVFSLGSVDVKDIEIISLTETELVGKTITKNPIDNTDTKDYTATLTFTAK